MADSGLAASPASRPCPRCGALFLGEICPSCPGAGESDVTFPPNPASEAGSPEPPAQPPTNPTNPRTARRRRTGRPLTSLRYLPRPPEPVRRQPAERLHHFRIERRPDGSLNELGRGGMGVTYKAFDERLRLPVALKVIAPFREHSTAAQSLFLREARAAARVRHSNVASVLYLNDTPGNFFYAMEFVDGISLEDWLKAQGPLPAATAIPLAEQIARGLSAIHAQGIIHRDLKPSNIMLVGGPDATGPRTVKIIDFGLARPIVRSESGTQSIGFRGTALYASPEQCEEASTLDGRSDLYSLGCIAFQMLAGVPPFTATSHRELMNQHVSAVVPVDRLAQVPTELRSIVARLLAKSPEERFANAELVIAEFERCRQLLAQRAAETPGHQTPLVDPHKSWVPHATTSSGRVSSEPISLRMQVPTPDPIQPLPLLGKMPAPELTELTLPPMPKRAPAPAPIPMPASEIEPLPPAGRDETMRRIAIGAAAVFALGLAIGILPRLGGPARNEPTAVATSLPAPSPTLAPAAVPPAAAQRRSVAVLPFANLSAGPETAYFAEGMHEDILTNLAKVRDLRVISRSSVQSFKPDAERNLKKIAATIGVSAIVEGSVRRSENKVRVTTQLIDAESGETLWAEAFDREMTDVIAVQNQIALAIAGALKASLTTGEKTALTAPLNTSANAYELFAKARVLMKGVGDIRHDFAKAEELLTEATKSDPSFARAFAQLSVLHTLRYAFGTDRTDERLAKSYTAARRAAQLGGSDFADGQVALGNYYFRGLADMPKALEYFERALKTEPQNPEALGSIANIQRRLGRWEDAIASYAALLRVSPLDPTAIHNHANSLRYLRRFAECQAALDAGRSRIGENPLIRFVQGDLDLAWKGDLTGLRAVVEHLKPNEITVEVPVFYRVRVLLLEGKTSEARQALEQSSFNLLDGQLYYVPRSALLAEIEEQAGGGPKAVALWKAALEDLAPLANIRSDARISIAHAMALAGAGEFEAACAEADRAANNKRLAQDAFDAPSVLFRRALVYLRSGRGPEARKQIDEMLARPGEVTTEWLRVDPAWKRLPPSQ